MMILAVEAAVGAAPHLDGAAVGAAHHLASPAAASRGPGRVSTSFLPCISINHSPF